MGYEFYSSFIGIIPTEITVGCYSQSLRTICNFCVNKKANGYNVWICFGPGLMNENYDQPVSCLAPVLA